MPKDNDFNLSTVMDNAATYGIADQNADLIQETQEELAGIWKIQVDALNTELQLIERVAERMLRAYMVKNYNYDVLTDPDLSDAPPCLYTKDSFSDLSSVVKNIENTDNLQSLDIKYVLELELGQRLETISTALYDAIEDYKGKNEVGLSAAYDALDEYVAQAATTGPRPEPE